jgi:hypothetical protein
MNQNQRGASPTILIALLILITLIGAVGYKFYTMTTDSGIGSSVVSKESPNQKNGDKSSDTLSNEGGVILAVCPDASQITRAELSKSVELDGLYAFYSGGCDVGSPTGANYFIKKINDRWQVVESGSGDIDCEKISSAGFPVSITQKCSGPDFTPEIQ